MEGETLKGHLDLLLLAVVQQETMHGYRIIEALRSRSRGAFDLAEGTVYPALHRLERAGLLASLWATAEGRRRRVYSLTRRGTAALEEQQQAWKQFARGMNAVLQGVLG
jgi:DNA-binding PadR family transcriptional regulator